MRSFHCIIAASLIAGSVGVAHAGSRQNQEQGASFFDLSYNGQVHKYNRHPYSGNGRFPSQIRAPGQKLFIFSPAHRSWAAYDASGVRVATGIANGGSDTNCPDLGGVCPSPKGVHRVYRKGSSDCKSKQFPVGVGGAPMPYCMFFKGGYAIHGSPWISNNNTSHGCIRVTTDAARWLSQNFMTVGTKVMIMDY